MTKSASPKITKQSAQALINYVKLQTKLIFTRQKKQKRVMKIVTPILVALAFAFFLIISFFLLRAVVSDGTIVKGWQLSILIFCIAQFLLLIISVSSQIKRLYNPSDSNIISTFPLTIFQRYLGEIITIYIKLFVYSFIIFYPFILIYGWACGLINVGFVFSSLFASLLLPLLPFSFSLIISVPFIYLSNWLHNKNILKLIIFIIVFTAILVIYSLLLRFMADWWIHQTSTDLEVLEGISKLLSSINHWYIFPFFNSEICIANNIGVNFVILLAICIGFMAIGISITKPLYQKFATTANNKNNSAQIKIINIKAKKPFSNMIVKEIKEIIRSQNYAFFYLGVAFSMPVLTCLITTLIQQIGQASTGSSQLFGFALLIICIIISLIGSYSANTISKEGKQFYITKTIPISYRKQLLAKAIVNFSVAFIGLLLCIIAIGSTVTKVKPAANYLGLLDLFFLFIICTLFLIGITFNGLNIDLARPKIDFNNGNPNESNIVIQMVIALAITAIISVWTTFAEALVGRSSAIVQSIDLVAVGIYAIINFTVFWMTANKKYERIEK